MKLKKLLVVMLATLLIAGVCGGAACTATSSAEAALKENQRYVYAYITSIAGSEVTYMEVEESVVTAMMGEEDTDEKNTEADKAEDAGSQKTEAGRGKASDRERQDSAENAGGMPDMGNMPSRGEGSSGGMQFGNMMETTTVTTYIPVGAPVYTATDVKTSFARLASGDLVKILVETNEAGEDVIEQIWMLL